MNYDPDTERIVILEEEDQTSKDSTQSIFLIGKLKFGQSYLQNKMKKALGKGLITLLNLNTHIS